MKDRKQEKSFVINQKTIQFYSCTLLQCSAISVAFYKIVERCQKWFVLFMSFHKCPLGVIVILRILIGCANKKCLFFYQNLCLFLQIATPWYISTFVLFSFLLGSNSCFFGVFFLCFDFLMWLWDDCKQMLGCWNKMWCCLMAHQPWRRVSELVNKVIVKPAWGGTAVTSARCWMVLLGKLELNAPTKSEPTLLQNKCFIFSYRNVTAVILQHLYKCKKKRDKMSLQTQIVMYKVMQAWMDAWVHYI